MAGAPLFSIIITTYFSEKTVRKCIDSVLAQTEPSYEIIVIDDASQDSTVSILKEYAQQNDNIKLILHPENHGQPFGLNAGIRAAEGKYISFVDGDDWVSPDCYARRKASLLTVPDADILIAGFTVNRLREDGEYETVTPPFPKNQPLTFHDMVSSVDNIHTGNHVSFSCRMLFRREFLQRENLLKNETVVVGEDTDFNLRALNRAKNVVVCDEVGYFYDTSNQNSIMRTRYKKTLENDIEVSYETRTAMCMDIKTYRRDLIEYYVKQWTFMVIHNQINSPEGLTPDALRRILNLPCFRETWKATGFRLYHKGSRDLILRLLIKFRLVHLYCYLINRSRK